MARPGVFGPYRVGRKWRIHIRLPGSPAAYKSFDTKEEAEEAVKAYRLALPNQDLVRDVLTQYEEYLVQKGNRASSNETTMYFLRGLLDESDTMNQLSPKRMEKSYLDYAATHSVDTSRNALAQLRTFFNWCIKKKIVRKNPTANITPMGRRKKGKKQLKKSESRKFAGLSLQLAQKGDEGALAAHMSLILGLRSGEVTKRKVGDVDVNEDGTLLWIDKGKSKAAERAVGVPDPLVRILLERTKGKKRDAWLFPSTASSGHRGKTWLRKNVKRICKLADVPVVSPHGLRGTNATMMMLAGFDSNALTRWLGHTSFTMTKEHYLAPGTIEQVRAENMAKIMEVDDESEDD